MQKLIVFLKVIPKHEMKRYYNFFNYNLFKGSLVDVNYGGLLFSEIKF